MIEIPACIALGMFWMFIVLEVRAGRTNVLRETTIWDVVRRMSRRFQLEVIPAYRRLGEAMREANRKQDEAIRSWHTYGMAVDVAAEGRTLRYSLDEFGSVWVDEVQRIDG